MEIQHEPVGLTIGDEFYDGVTFKGAVYENGLAAIALIDADGVLLAKATVNVVPNIPMPGCVFIKDWGENEGLLDELVRLGVCELTGREVPSGFVTVKEAKLRGEFAEFIARAEGRS